MASDSIQVSAIIPASAGRIYDAWLDSAEHGAMTGGVASIEAAVGGHYTAWDGYIEGVVLELDPGRRIVQTWRSGDFPDGSMDSRLEVTLEEVEGGTRVTLLHTDIPDGQVTALEKGWHQYYLDPMAAYFERGERPSPAPMAAPVRARKAAKRKSAAKSGTVAVARKGTKPAKKAARKASRPAKKAARRAPARAARKRVVKKRVVRKPVVKKRVVKKGVAGKRPPKRGSGTAARKAVARRKPARAAKKRAPKQRVRRGR